MIVPVGQELPAKDGIQLEISDTLNTEMVAKAKELLTEPLSNGALIDVLEYYYIYGRAPEIVLGKPKVTGKNIPVEAGHTSQHYTSDQLKKVVDIVDKDLAPVVEEEIIPEEVIK